MGTGSRIYSSTIQSDWEPAREVSHRQTPIDFGPEFMFMDLFDLNGDGNLDAIGNSQGLLAAKLGNGRGGFPSSTTLTADAVAFSTLQDVNGDGVLDFVYSDHLAFGSTQSDPVVESVSIAPAVSSGTNQTCHPRCKGR